MLSSLESAHTAAMRSATEVSLAIRNIHQRCNRSRQDRQPPQPLQQQQQHSSTALTSPVAVGGAGASNSSSGAHHPLAKQRRSHTQSLSRAAASQGNNNRSSGRRSMSTSHATPGGSAVSEEEADCGDGTGGQSDDEATLSRRWRAAEAGHQQHIDGVACAWSERSAATKQHQQQKQWNERANYERDSDSSRLQPQLSPSGQAWPVQAGDARVSLAAARRASANDRAVATQAGAARERRSHQQQARLKLRSRHPSMPLPVHATTATTTSAASGSSATVSTGDVRRGGALLGSSGSHPHHSAAASHPSADTGPLLSGHLSDIAERISELQYVITAVNTDERQAAQQAHNESVKQRQQQQQAAHGSVSHASHAATAATFSSIQSAPTLPAATPVSASAAAVSSSAESAAAAG